MVYAADCWMTLCRPVASFSFQLDDKQGIQETGINEFHGKNVAREKPKESNLENGIGGSSVERSNLRLGESICRGTSATVWTQPRRKSSP